MRYLVDVAECRQLLADDSEDGRGTGRSFVGGIAFAWGDRADSAEDSTPGGVPVVIEEELQLLEVDGLDEVGVESGLSESAPVFFLAVAGHGHEDRAIGSEVLSWRQRRATS